MENIYAFVNEKLDPKLRRKCIYNLDFDKQGTPFIFIKYKCGEQILDMFDYVGQQNNEVEEFAAELTRLTRDCNNLNSISKLFKPVVLDYQKNNLKFSYGHDLKTLGPIDLSQDILLGFIVDEEKYLKPEEKQTILEHIIESMKELHENNDYIFEVVRKEKYQGHIHM